MPQKDVESCALRAKIQAFQSICVLSVTLTLQSAAISLRHVQQPYTLGVEEGGQTGKRLSASMAPA